MKKPHWELTIYNNRQYAKYGKMLFKCCVGKKNAPDGWVYIREINRWVSYKCVG